MRNHPCFALICFLLAAGAVCLWGYPPSASAADAAGDTFTEGGLLYKITSTSESALQTVSVGTGKAADADVSARGSLEVPSRVTHGGTSYTVTAVDAYAFSKGNGAAAEISSVSLPATVKSVGARAFYGCTGLRALALAPQGSLEGIGEYAFGNCSSLTGVEIPSSVTRIGMFAFSNCTSMSMLEFADPNAAAPTLNMGEGTFRAPANADCALRRVQLPARLASIPASAFQNQSSLVTVGCSARSMTSVGSSAFRGCSSVTELEIPDFTSSVNPVGSYAFTDMQSLETISFVGNQSYAISDSTFAASLSQNVLYTGTDYRYPPVKTVLYYGDHVSAIFPGANHYQRISYFANRANAEGQANELGEAYVRDDVRLAEAESLAGQSDGKGPYVYAGSVPASGSGMAWKYLGGSQVGHATKYLKAYPVAVADLSCGEIVMDGDSVDYDGSPARVDFSVVDAAGRVLEEGEDYRFAISNSLGEQVAQGKLESLGSYTVSVQGTGSYTGATSKEFSLVEHTCTWLRCSGNARYSVGNHLLDSAYSPDDVDTVILVDEAALSAGAAAGGLAGVRSAPIAVNSGDALTAEARRTLNTYRPSSVFLVGIAKPKSIEAEIHSLLDANVVVTNAFAAKTQQGIALNMYERTKGSGYWDKSTTALVANVADAAGAAVAGVYGYQSTSPVFLTDARGKLDAGTLKALATGGFERVVFCDFSAAGAARLASQLEGAGCKATTRNWAAQDPYGLSILAMKDAVEEGICSYDKATLVSPGDLSSVITAVSTCGKNASPLLYADDGKLGGRVLDEVLKSQRYEISTGYVFGVRGYLSEELKNQVEKIWLANDKWNLALAKVSLDKSVFPADGALHIPVLRVADSEGKQLVEGRDYTVWYFANDTDRRAYEQGFKEKGGYTALVQPAAGSAYSGSRGVSFSIGAAEIDQADVKVAAAGLVYTGGKLSPALTVNYGGGRLVPNVDYRASYAFNVDAGCGLVTVSGKGAYAGRVIAAFEIAPVSLAGARVTFAKPSCVYTGKAQHPASSLKVGKATLEPGSDCAVSYPKAVKCGSYRARITGTNNSVGTADASFSIVRAKQSISVKKASRSYTARALKKAAVRFSLGARAKTGLSYSLDARARRAGVKVGKTGAVTLRRGTGRGVYTVKIAAKKTACYKSARKSVRIKVS